MSQENVNDNLVLISGISGTGKSMTLRNLRDQEGVMYLNCENGKKLPFRNKFDSYVITDPYQVYDGFEHASTSGNHHTIVIDTISFLMDMYESVHVIGSSDSRAMWGSYAQYWKNLMQQYVANSPCNVIILGHLTSELVEGKGYIEAVPVKGALRNVSLEASFSTAFSTRIKTLKELEGYKNDLLTITPREEALGYKHVIQTQITKDTTLSRIRSPLELFTFEETFIDNCAQKVLDRLVEYYNF